MAVAASTIETLGFSSTPTLLNWSTLDSGSNNQYIDVSDIDCSKLILLVANLNSSDVGATCGYIYIGSSNEASSGSCWAASYVGRGSAWARMKFKMTSLNTSTGTYSLQSTGGNIAIQAIGPFDATRFKDSNGYIKISKVKATSDLGNVKVCPILVP